MMRSSSRLPIRSDCIGESEVKVDLRRRFEDYCDRESLIWDGQSLLIGLSGGADSVCLFNLLTDISAKRNLKLTAVHVHHGIRGSEADRDAGFAREMAHDRGVDFVLKHVDVPGYVREHGLSEEEAARRLRYEALDEVLAEVGADAIALAHHRDDQTETILMNLFRGTGPVGLMGMRPVSGSRIRPLLFATKKEILDHLEKENITFVEDSTNFEPDHTRNRIRHELIPLMNELYNEAGSRVAAIADDIACWYNFVREKTDEARALADCEKGTIPREVYLSQPEAVRIEWIREAVAEVIPGRKDVKREHYNAIRELIEDDVSGRKIDLPSGIKAVRTYAGLSLEKSDNEAGELPAGKPDTEPDKGIPLAIPGETCIQTKDGIMRFYAELVDVDIFNQKKHDFSEEKDYTKYFDYDKIENDVLLRYPAEGDYFVMDAQGRKKLLGRFFIDEKVEKSLRRVTPVIADGSHIMWVLPHRMSEMYKVGETTERVLKITRSERNAI